MLAESAKELFYESLLEARAAGGLGDRPLIVLTAGYRRPLPAIPRRLASWWPPSNSGSQAKLNSLDFRREENRSYLRTAAKGFNGTAPTQSSKPSMR
jgi:hypothetical protein